MEKIALITGITGQDGAYLSNLLLKKDYRIIGIVRDKNKMNLKGLEYLKINNSIEFEECNLLDYKSVLNIIEKHLPDEIYNLAAQSSVYLSFKQPIDTFQFNTLSVLNILEAIKNTNKKIKLYQASTSEMFGIVKNLPIKEDTQFYPQSPYAVSKAAAHWACVNYRESYGIFAACGILFNHESYLRRDNFFIKKLISQCLSIKKGLIDCIELGNLNIKRDFGFSPNYVEAMYLMLQTTDPLSLLICSGESISLKEIVVHVFDSLGISQDRLIVNKDLFRPNEIDEIYGDPKKAKEILGWEYNLSFKNVLDILLDEEIRNFDQIDLKIQNFKTL